MEGMSPNDTRTVEMMALRNEHRDSIWKLFARSSETISAFMYQAVIFDAQITCYRESDWNPMTPLGSAETFRLGSRCFASTCTYLRRRVSLSSTSYSMACALRKIRTRAI